MQHLKGIVDFKYIVMGSENVDGYVEKLLRPLASQPKIILGTNRRTLLTSMARELDEFFNTFTGEIKIDVGNGSIEIHTTSNLNEVKETLKQKLQDYKVSFSNDRVPVDILYNRMKKELDPNMIMYPNNPRFMEVS